MVVRVFDGIQAKWSPDGKEFAFAHMGEDSVDTLCVMNVDGTNLRKIARWGLDPKWSPDGEKILCSKIGRLTLLNPKESYMDDDRKLKRLSDHSVLMGDDFNWSPNGKDIAFIEHTTEGQNHISSLYVMDADGSNLRCLMKDDERRSHVSWSQDSQWIVCQGKGIELFNVINGSHSVLSSHGIYPSWSPIGNKIAFYTYYGIYRQDERPTISHGIHLLDYGSREIETVVLGKKEIGRTLTPLSWSPNGEFIAFEAKQTRLFREDENALYLLKTRDKKLIKLIDGKHANDSSISWSPDSLKVGVCLTPDFNTHVLQVSESIT